MERIKNYIIICLFAIIGVLLLLKQCGDDSISKPKEVFLKGKETIKYDTIKASYKVVEFKKQYYPKWDTIYSSDTVIDFAECNKVRVYNDSTYDDSITIYTGIETAGVLKSTAISYRWKVPTINKTISRTDTLVRPSKVSLYTGLGLSGNQTSFNASPFVTLNVKRVSLTVGYGLIDKTYQIGIGYRIFKSKK